MNARILETFTAAICLTMLAAGSASAGAVCFHDGASPYRFSKLKLPKKAGDTTSFTGVRYGGFGPSPVSGVALKLTSGPTVITFTVHSGSGAGNNFELSWYATDSTLAGTASFDNDGDLAKDDGTLPMTVVGCDTVPIL